MKRDPRKRNTVFGKALRRKETPASKSVPQEYVPSALTYSTIHPLLRPHPSAWLASSMGIYTANAVILRRRLGKFGLPRARRKSKQ